MSTLIAVNGFGRIGRGFVRAAVESGADLEIVAVNDVADASTLAHLLTYDSIYGRFPLPVRAENGVLHVGEQQIRVFAESDPEDLPWDELEVDVVIESSGRFRTHAAAALHMATGAAKVILSAAARGPVGADATLVLGVNDHLYDPDRHHIIATASCTTNCLAPVAGVLHGTVGILHGSMTSIHAYTADQQLHDAPHGDLRRARAAGLNLIPTSTGAADTIGLVIPELAGRLHGYAIRVPLATGSLVDLTIESEVATSAEEVNAAFAACADRGPLAGILAYSDAPIVSSDIVKSPYSAIFDAPLTSVTDGTQVKVVAWYDNEWGYANRLVELAARVLVPVPAPAS